MYKRQYADRATLWNSAEEVEKQWNSQLATVSYTHLDVYKRQGIGFTLLLSLLMFGIVAFLYGFDGYNTIFQFVLLRP